MIVPDRNEKDMDDIPKALRRKLHWVLAKNMSDVLKNALLNGKRDAKETRRAAAAKTKLGSAKGKLRRGARSLPKSHGDRAIPLRP